MAYDQKYYPENYVEPPYCNMAGQREIACLRELLLRSHGALMHGAASDAAHVLLLRDIETTLGLKSDAELLKSES